MALATGTLALVAGTARVYPWQSPSRIDAFEVVGEGAIALAFLVVLVSIHRFRTSLDTRVYYPFVVGFTFLYFSAVLDFVDEFVVVGSLLTYAVENAGGVLGAVSLAVAFGYWVDQYEKRGRRLTEQENRLQYRSDQLEVLNRIIRHDVRNDLSVVVGRIQMATDLVGGDAEGHLESAHRSAVDAIALTDNARDFVDELDEDETRDVAPVPLRETLAAQVDRIRQSYPGARIRFEHGSGPEIPVLAGDMLSSVFRNLLSNAVQHNDGPAAHVTVSIETDDDSAVVRVADDGPGVPAELRSRLFDRGESGLRSDGTGVGLYLVDRLVSQYAGEVWVEPNEPSGAVFSVRLRRA